MKKDEQVHIKEIKMKECRFFLQTVIVCVSQVQACVRYMLLP